MSYGGPPEFPVEGTPDEMEPVHDIRSPAGSSIASFGSKRQAPAPGKIRSLKGNLMKPVPPQQALALQVANSPELLRGSRVPRRKAFTTRG